MLADYHTHTRLCKHALGEPDDYRAAAARAGLPELAATDHAWNPPQIGRDVAMDGDQFPLYRAMVDRARARQPPPEMLFGIEADYYPGCEDYWSGWLPAQGFDVVLVSVHYIGGWAFDNPAYADSWKSVDVAGAWRAYMDLVAAAAASGLFDVITHFDLPKKFGHRLGDRPLRECVLPVLDRLAAGGMALEVNTGGLRVPVTEIYPSDLILSWAREREIPVVFGSDAHDPAQVGYEFPKALKLARDVGYATCARFRRRERRSASLPSAPGPGGHPAAAGRAS